MDTFFQLIDKTSAPREEFDVQRYNDIVTQFGVGKYDDFISYFAFFLYEFPLPEKLKKIFDKKDLSGKMGITSRHLIKIAKRLNINQDLIDYYFDLKNSRASYKRSLEYVIEDIDEVEKEMKVEQDFDFRKHQNLIQRYSRNEQGYKIYIREFNRVTFKLINSVLESK